MNLLRKFFDNTSYKFIQGDSHRNRAALKGLLALGFPVNRIRKTLIDLNEIKIQGLANGIAAPTLYATLRGEKQNNMAREILAGALGLTVEELFPE